jgi:predicted nucleotidyltransferase
VDEKKGCLKYHENMAKNRPHPVSPRQPYRYVSPHIPPSAIRRFARQIAERFHPEKIVLFGSYAYGQPHEESDVDLLVIMPAYNEIAQAIRIRRECPRPFALDLIVKTPEGLDRALRDENWFLREVMSKGKVLYEAPDKAVGPQGRRGRSRSAHSRGGKAAAARHRVLPLSASGGKVSQGDASGVGRRLPKDA